MKKVLAVIIAGILTFVGCFKISNVIDEKIDSVFSYKNNRTTVVIDPGHGGADCGTIGADGALEKVINLTISLILYDYLMVSGIDAKMVREGDYELLNVNEGRKKSDLYNRLDFVNSVPNSILVSIHQNHFDNSDEWGTQIWYSPNDDKSKIIADSILKVIKENIQQGNKRFNKPSDKSYYILYNAIVPSIMIECGFMSNIEENMKLQQDEYQKDFAYSVLVGLVGEL